MMEEVWYHPFFVHFVVALFLFSVVMDWLGQWRNNDHLIKSGWHALNGTVFFIPFAIISGLHSQNSTIIQPQISDSLQLHLNFTLLAASGIIILFLIRLAERGNIPTKHKKWLIFLQLSTLFFLLIAAHSGGEIVYGDLLQ